MQRAHEEDGDEKPPHEREGRILRRNAPTGDPDVQRTLHHRRHEQRAPDDGEPHREELEQQRPRENDTQELDHGVAILNRLRTALQRLPRH